ncbi:7802_t:CDS:2 [Acaulospora morrowiae]|uniref:7802_t:CDS:1 n=1 Tax=Acaulospora morrowiae TaxID=94023 RepID=A0A9N9CN11_9GLOM|nr:7802_t:CDS:2 [Acaulospora morrowiae]
MDQLNSLTLWDVKDVFNKVKNVVMNYTEMEAKVREATNNEPWGASSTLMQEIAQGTYSYQHFNEIMPTIYKRFTEKEARQWRQIYKALQLLEYLVKHGPERVVDDARAHMATIKLLRNFTYIDEKGKDQGINVRNRAKELAELLSDVEKIRQERKKARANRTKYTGVSSDAFGYGGSSRYGGFGNDSYSSYNEDRIRTRYDEPETQWQSDYRIGRTSPTDDRRSSVVATRFSQSSAKKSVELSPTNSEVKNEVNLFDFGETPNSISNPSTFTNDFGTLQSAAVDEEFQEFQSAPSPVPSSQRSSITQPPSSLAGLQINPVPQVHPIVNNSASSATVNKPGVNNNLLDDLLGPSPVIASQSTSLPVVTGSINSTLPISPTKTNSPTTPKQNSSNSKPAFPALKSDDIWAQASNLVSLDSLGKDTSTKQPTKPSMNSLAQADSSSWAVKGTWTGVQQMQHNPGGAQKPQDPFDLLM